MKTNRWLKALALAMTVCMMLTALTIPTFAADDLVNNYEGFDEWDGSTFDTTPFDGITADNGGADCTLPDGQTAIIIDTAAKLAGLAKVVNDAAVGNKAYGAYKNIPIYITKNINLNGHSFPSIGKDYTVAMFSGLLEGRLDGVEGKAVTIANACVNTPSKNNSGFIGNVRGGAVKNITLVDAEVGNKTNGGAQGILVGYASKEVELSGLTVINSTLVGSTAGGTISHGGVIGTIKSSNELELKDIKAINVTFACPHTMSSMIGGVIGFLQSESGKQNTYNLENCYFSGTFVNSSSNFDATYLYPSVYVGGIVASVQGASNVSMKNCQFNGEIIADAASAHTAPFAAFVGDIYAGGSLKFENCLNSGKITNFTDALGENVVPMIGAAGGTLAVTVTNSYSVADNTKTVAIDETTIEMPNFTIVTSDSILGDGAQTTLAGFDFNGTWVANEGALPCLKSVNDELWIHSILCEHSYDTYSD